MYGVLEGLRPGSFAGVGSEMPVSFYQDWIYYSFVTLTTTGYGDISPVSGLARALAYMQAVVGQFYIAVLVAGLVGAYLVQPRKE